MSSSLRNLLDELYAIDPGLRDREAELLPLLRSMLEQRPDVKPDPAFVRELRARLHAVASAPSPRPRFATAVFSFPRAYAPLLAGLVIGVLVAAPATYVLLRSPSLPFPGAPERAGRPLFSSSIRKEATNKAFGDLRSLAPQAAAPTGRGGGGGGGGLGTDLAQPSPQPGILPAFQEYAYVYDGDLPSLPKSVDVLQRVQEENALDLSVIIGSFNPGLLDLTSFPGASVESMTFSQQSDFGYTINVMLRDGQIGISQNYAKWPHPEASCTDEACYKRNRVQIGEVPSDDVLIGVARDFVAAHGIDLSRYGAPEADRVWKEQYDATPDKEQAYVPESIRVLFPLLIDGKPVYDQGGGKVGVGVSVNVRTKRVSDVWGLQDQSYRSSSYDGTDAAAVKEYLKNFERPPAEFRKPGMTTQTTTVELGAPQEGYMVYDKPDGMRSRELLVPALLFPVTKPPAGQPGFRSVVPVPLAKDLLTIDR